MHRIVALRFVGSSGRSAAMPPECRLCCDDEPDFTAPTCQAKLFRQKLRADPPSLREHREMGFSLPQHARIGRPPPQPIETGRDVPVRAAQGGRGRRGTAAGRA